MTAETHNRPTVVTDADTWLDTVTVPAASRPRSPRRTVSAYHRSHTMFRVWLTADEARRVLRLQKRHQLSRVDWVRQAIARDEATRPSEAGDYVRKIVPEALATLMEEVCTRQGEALMAMADRPQLDWAARKQYRQDAGAYLDAASWFTEVRQQYQRFRATPDGSPSPTSA